MKSILSANLSKKLTGKLVANSHSAVIAMTAIGMLSIVTAGTATAQTPTQIKQNKAWGAFSYAASDGKVCYVLSIPTDKQPATKDGKSVDHGDVFFMLSQHPGQNVRLEPQFTVGYAMQENSKVVLDIDGKKFSMFTRGQNAWLENPAEETAVVAAMKAGAKMSLVAVSSRGTQTSYSYSLSGITASINDISSCK